MTSSPSSSSLQQPHQHSSSIFPVSRPIATEHSFFAMNTNNASTRHSRPEISVNVNDGITSNKSGEQIISSPSPNKSNNSASQIKIANNKQPSDALRSVNILTPVTPICVSVVGADGDYDNNNNEHEKSLPHLHRTFLASLTQYPFAENSIINIPDTYFKYYRLPAFLICSLFVVAAIALAMIFIFLQILDFSGDASKSVVKRWLPVLGPGLLLLIGIILSFLPEKIYLTFDRRHKELCYIRYRVAWFCLSRTAVVKFRHITGVEAKESYVGRGGGTKYYSVVLTTSKVRNGPLFANSILPSEYSGSCSNSFRYGNTKINTTTNLNNNSQQSRNPLQGSNNNNEESAVEKIATENSFGSSSSPSDQNNNSSNKIGNVSGDDNDGESSRTGGNTMTKQNSSTQRKRLGGGGIVVVSASASPSASNIVPDAIIHKKTKISHFAEIDSEQDDENDENNRSRSSVNHNSRSLNASTSEHPSNVLVLEKAAAGADDIFGEAHNINHNNNDKSFGEMNENEEEDDPEERELVLDEVESSEVEGCKRIWIHYLRSIGIQI